MSTSSEVSSNTRVARILIVDDHPTTREGLTQYLGRCTEMQVCGVADDISSAHAAVAELQPDLVIVDMNLRDSSGLEFIRQLRKVDQRIGLLAWSMHDKALFAARAIKAGASDYVSKMQSTEDVVTSVRRILRNESAPIQPKLTTAKIGRGKKTRADGETTVEDLSDRELQVLQMMGEGMSMVQMTERTQLSPKTIETYRARIKQKLSLTNNAELMRHAVQFVLEGCNRRGAEV